MTVYSAGPGVPRAPPGPCPAHATTCPPHGGRRAGGSGAWGRPLAGNVDAAWATEGARSQGATWPAAAGPGYSPASPARQDLLPQARPSGRSLPSTGAFCPQTDTCWSLWENPASLLFMIPQSPWKHLLPQEALQAALSSRDVAQSASGAFPAQPVAQDGRVPGWTDEHPRGSPCFSGQGVCHAARRVHGQPAARPGPSPGGPAPCGSQGQCQRERQMAAWGGAGSPPEATVGWP